jgi:molecular chaperone GrpE
MEEDMKHSKQRNEQAPNDLQEEMQNGGATAEEISPEVDLSAQLEEAAAKRDEYLDLAQRVQAEFENYRRRSQNVRAQAFDDGARAFIKTVLPVCDNLERALSVDSTDKSLKEGVQMVLRQLMETLEKRGVETIDRLGERFDPNLEEAVAQDDPSLGEPGAVSEVLLKGYKMGDTVLRHAMVKVIAE